MNRTLLIGSMVAVLMMMATLDSGTAIAQETTASPAALNGDPFGPEEARALPAGVVDVGVKTFTILQSPQKVAVAKEAPKWAQKLAEQEGVTFVRITGRKLEVGVGKGVIGAAEEAGAVHDSDCPNNSGFNEHLATTGDQKLLRGIVDEVVTAITRTRHPKIPSTYVARITRNDGHIDVTLAKPPQPALNQVGFAR